MKYELYVIRESQKFEVDLSNPSGITLKFKSTLFGDITKITASHSYSFSIPKTERNRTIFDSIEDMRHNSVMFGIKIPAELHLEGVPLFTDGYLYINDVEGTYSAVLTWDICKGLETIKDDDMSIKKLVELETNNGNKVYATQRYTGKDANFDNLSVVSPAYTTQEYGKIEESVSLVQFYNPCVPLYKILKAIENYYHITIKLGEHISRLAPDDFWDIPEVITPEYLVNYGVLPFVTRVATDTIKNATLTSQTLEVTNYRVNQLPDVFNQDAKGRDEAMFWDDEEDDWLYGRHLFRIGPADSTPDTTTLQNEWYSVSEYKIKAKKNCRLRVRFVTNIYHGSESESQSNVDNPDSRTIWCYRYRPPRPRPNRFGYIPRYYEKIDEFSGSVEKTWDENYAVVYVNQIHTISVEIDDFLEGDELFFVWGQTYQEVFPSFTVEEPLTVTIDPHPSQQSNYKVEICDNLPEVTCLNLLKAIYFAAGGFPRINKKGEMEFIRYTDVKDNIRNGKAYNWSDKLLKGLGSDDSITLSFEGIAQKSYLLMGNEQTSGEKQTEDDGAWDSPMFCINCESQLLDRTGEIYKFPFYGRFITNRILNQNLDLYESYDYRLAKAEENKDFHWASPLHPEGRYLFKETEGKPALGLIYRPYNGGGVNMSTWSTRMVSEQYDFLQKMMRKPYVIKERMTLSVVDLMNLDYSRPVYISRYNSYFAIISVEVGNDGISNVELIRIVT